MPSASSWSRGAHDVGDAAVVPEVDHLGAVRLQDAADDVDRGVVSIEQRRGADEAQRRALSGAALIQLSSRNTHWKSRLTC